MTNFTSVLITILVVLAFAAVIFGALVIFSLVRIAKIEREYVEEG